MSNNNKRNSKEQVKANPGGAPIHLKNINIDVRPFHRGEQDIESWRTAHKSAESLVPRRVLLYDLYADVELDGHVEAVTQKRKDAVTSANWKFVDKEGQEVDEINELIDSIGFEELLDEIISSKFWGYSMVEPKPFINSEGSWELSLYVIPKLNMVPERGLISRNAYSNEGLNIRQGRYAKTIMEIGKTKDLGLYLKAAPYQILKRGGLGDYAMFVQVFGNPLVDATWDGMDENQRLKLLEAVQALGSGGAIVRPQGTTLDLKDKQSNANGDLQTKFIALLNKEISKCLLGSTETTESSESSGYAQSKTHEGQDDRKHETDITFCRRILNSRFIKILKAYGFDTKEGRFMVAGEEDSLTSSEMFAIHKGLKNDLGLPIDDDFLYETYSIPKPADYNAQKAEKAEKAQAIAQSGKGVKEEADDKAGTKPATKKAAKKTSKKALQKGENIEEVETEDEGKEKVSLGFISKIIQLFTPGNNTGKKGAVQMPNVIRPAVSSLLKLSEIENDISSENERLLNEVYNSQGKYNFDEILFKKTANALLKGFKNGWQKGFNEAGGNISLTDLGFTYGINNPELIKAFETNLFRFSAGKSLAEVQLLNELFMQSNSFEQFYELAIAKLKIFNSNWLETEYNTAILIGESAATYQRLIQQTDIFPYWMYQTQRDEDVRKSHKAIQGIVLRWDDPRWAKLFPPNGWLCRCYIVPRTAGEFDAAKLEADQAKADAYLDSPEFEKLTAQGFGINRGVTGEVFTQNQQYRKALPDYVLLAVKELQKERDQ